MMKGLFIYYSNTIKYLGKHGTFFNTKQVYIKINFTTLKV